jgi:hypothetical protein
MPDTDENKDLELSINDQYFLAIGKQKEHSFMMLGVMHHGEPTLLARVGKQRVGGASPQENSETTRIKILPRYIGQITSEGLKRKSDTRTQIHYQAYDVSYQQVTEFLKLIATIEKNQFADAHIRNAIINEVRSQVINSNKAKLKNYQNQLLIARRTGIYKQDKLKEIEEQINYHQREIDAANDIDASKNIILENESISCYFPESSSSSEQITFKYGKLYQAISSESSKLLVEKLSKQAQELHINNTCRTTALNIVEKILGFKTNISPNFFIAPNYKTTLIEGQPDKESFYILPPPPEAYNINETDKKAWLRILYDRLNETPKTNPSARSMWKEGLLAIKCTNQMEDLISISPKMK